MTLRFDAINLFDTVYIRDGSGIGVFAPQYGPRRGFFCHVEEVRRRTAGIGCILLQKTSSSSRTIRLSTIGPASISAAILSLERAERRKFFRHAWQQLLAGTNLQTVGGGQIGVNYQFWNRLIVGAEAMFDWLPSSQLSPILPRDRSDRDGFRQYPERERHAVGYCHRPAWLCWTASSFMRKAAAPGWQGTVLPFR